MVLDRGRSSGGTPPHLKSMDQPPPPPHSPHSASLRGSHHRKVPDISDRPFNTMLPQTKTGEQHPEPYYVTEPVT